MEKNGMNNNTNMKQYIDTNISDLVSEFKQLFTASAQELSSQEKITIWLSGWSSVNHFYAEMVNIFSELSPDLRKKIYFFFLDERVVDFSDPDSNYLWLNESLLQPLIQNWYIDKTQVLLPDFSLEDFAEDYSKKVEKIDIWLFWVGPDGHTCSLFPNHKLLDDSSDWYLQIHDSPKPPLHRITVSKNMLLHTQFAYTFFMGESKKSAYANFINPEILVHDCPVKLTQNCRNSYVFCDQLMGE
jgi:6-phosphogluconolactonase